MAIYASDNGSVPLPLVSELGIVDLESVLDFVVLERLDELGILYEKVVLSEYVE